MVRRSRGARSKTRQILRKKPRERGLSPITRALQEFEKGEKVSIVIDPSIHKGIPHRRYHGKTGDIEEKRGDSYIVKIKNGNMIKNIIVRPEHMKKV
ncbi:MAG: 50S ribosomal protein L21e [Candidatus Thermoplasmatota archaeon]|nr:50S ribosomal protein L21e [Candidatus Thermoplasmatota archaeon]